MERVPAELSTAGVARGNGSNKKCTEPVSPSSGNPTDLRRSGCHSENHQPRALRTRCKPHTRGVVHLRQGLSRYACRNLRSFLFATVELRSRAHALVGLREEKKGRSRKPGRVSRRLDGGSRAGLPASPAPERRSSPSRERFRPPSRRTFRFRVVLLGGLRPTGAPCSAQTESRRSDGSDQGVSATKLRANCGCSAKTAESV